MDNHLPSQPSDSADSNHHILYPYNDSRGRLAGVTIPTEYPFDSLAQWQKLAEGLLSGILKTTPNEQIEGLYAVTFNNTKTEEQVTGLHILRLSQNNDISKAVSNETENGFPKHTLGLLAVIHEADKEIRTATLALRGGYTTGAEKMHQDRVLATIVDNNGNVVNPQLDRHTKTSLRLLGKMMIKALDQDLDNLKLARQYSA